VLVKETAQLHLPVVSQVGHVVDEERTAASLSKRLPKRVLTGTRGIDGARDEGAMLMTAAGVDVSCTRFSLAACHRRDQHRRAESRCQFDVVEHKGHRAVAGGYRVFEPSPATRMYIPRLV
jgi:hypothetical protein